MNFMNNAEYINILCSLAEFEKFFKILLKTDASLSLKVYKLLMI